MNTKVFSERLKETRLNQKITQAQLAQKAEVTAATISAYESTDESKRKKPSLDNALKLAKALNVSLDWLCGISDGNTHQRTEIILTSLLSFVFDNPYRTEIKRELLTYPDLSDNFWDCWLEVAIENGSKLSDFLSKAIELKQIATKDILTPDMLETLKKSLIDRYSGIEWKSLICYDDCKVGDDYGDNQTAQ